MQIRSKQPTLLPLVCEVIQINNLLLFSPVGIVYFYYGSSCNDDKNCLSLVSYLACLNLSH